MKLIPNGVTRAVAKKVLQTKKNSPHLFFAAGVAGVVGTTVLACRATLKLEETLDEIQTDIDKFKAQANSEEVKEHGGYSVDDYNRDLVVVYTRSTMKLVKLYGPTALVGMASIACLAGSHVQMTRRNAALMATVGALNQAFNEYRERVREELGDDREQEVFHNIHKTQNEESSEVQKIKAEHGMGPNARLFDEHTSDYWKPSAELNRYFILGQQNYANNKLERDGFVLLNDVYELLGFPRTSDGAVLGWVRGGGKNGDGYIDFRMFELTRTNQEYCVWLDFNYDGVVFDLIDKF